MIKLYNTLTREKEEFVPIDKNEVGLYSCGPTVYWFSHIGNLMAYIFNDILKRTLEYNDYKVKHVINITDVGHLTSDADEGEDKLEKGAKRENKTAWEVAEFYTNAFKDDLKKLNIIEPNVWTKATDYIKEQIELIVKLEKKGFTYKTSDGIYFDTSKSKNYGKLARLKVEDLKAGARVEMSKEKKNITDFALWKFSYPNGRSFDITSDDATSCRQMEWGSPWGVGFPGWHTECVAMSAKNLGTPFDIHTGGIDHIPVHHTNEIAQSEALFNNTLANIWMHNEFLVMKEKMSKSLGNVILVDTLIEKGFNPLAFRYLCLTAHYRTPINFSFESLESAQNGLKNLYNKISEINTEKNDDVDEKNIEKVKTEFKKNVNDDLNIPQALALLWNVLKDNKLSDAEKYELALDFDKVFGLELRNIKQEEIPQKIIDLANERENARKEKDWDKSDKLRDEIKKLGYEVEDNKDGQTFKKF